MALIDKETIRKEIERRIKVAKVEYESTHAPEYEGIDIELNALLSFLDTLPDEPVDKHVDVEAAMKKLEEKIKLASKDWKGVDVDEYIDKVRYGKDT